MAELIPIQQVRAWRSRHFCNKVVATNGCFDILHTGHLRCLESAKHYGELLIVGINSDAAVRALKGEGRPVNSEEDRAALVLGLRCVDAVCVFPGERATEFLDLCRPDVYVKGGDYDIENLDPGELAALDHHGTEIYFVPTVEGKSTTRVWQQIAGASS